MVLRFDILETYDGFTGEVLIEGDPNCNLQLSGTVEGVDSFSKFPVNFYRLLGKTLVNILLGILFLGLMALTGGIGRSYEPDHVYHKTRREYESDPTFKAEVDDLEAKYNFYQEQKEKITLIINPKDEKTEAKRLRRKKRFTRTLISIAVIVVIAAITIAWITAKEEITEKPSNYIPGTIRINNQESQSTDQPDLIDRILGFFGPEN